MASERKIAAVVAMLCEAFSRKPTVATFKAYEIGLAGVSDEQLNAAANAVLADTGEFMPTPGQLRALSQTGGCGYEAQADSAWATLCRAIDKYGGGRSINFRDAVINATIRFMGGWEYICERPKEDFEVWTKKAFLETYVRFMRCGCPTDLTGYLIGGNEKANGVWVGRAVGVEGKPFELPSPEEVGCDYQPLVISKPKQRPALNNRPAAMPRIELKRVGVQERVN